MAPTRHMLGCAQRGPNEYEICSGTHLRKPSDASAPLMGTMSRPEDTLGCPLLLGIVLLLRSGRDVLCVPLVIGMMYSHAVPRDSHLPHLGRPRSHFVFELVHEEQDFWRKLGAGPGEHRLLCRINDDSVSYQLHIEWRGATRLVSDFG